MKALKLYNILSITLLIALCSSCYTTEKFTVSTSPGAKIYLPKSTHNNYSTTNQSGKSKIEISSDIYCGYILVQPEGMNVKIPMGLDLCTKGRYGTKLACGLGYTLTAIGTAGVVGSTIVAIVAGKDEDAKRTAGLIMGGSAALGGIGAAIGVPAESRLSQVTYDYNFGYEKMQLIDMPNLSMSLLHPNPEKNKPFPTEEKLSSRKKASSGKAIEKKDNTGSKANKSRSSIANKVCGIYKGNGQLLYNKNQEEYYPEISLNITQIDKDHVNVIIIEGDEEFFEEPLEYVVKTDKKGGYILSIPNLSDATIKITKTGALVFDHNKVNIDNKMYRLLLKGQKIKK